MSNLENIAVTRTSKPFKMIILIFAVLLPIIILLLIGILNDWNLIAGIKDFLIRPDSNLFVFVVLLLLLPLTGFPMSVICVAVGIKFGSWLGLVSIATAIAIHLLISFLAVHSYLKQPIEHFLERRNWLPNLNPDHKIMTGAIIMAAPDGEKYRIGFFWASAHQIFIGGLAYTGFICFAICSCDIVNKN